MAKDSALMRPVRPNYDFTQYILGNRAVSGPLAKVYAHFAKLPEGTAVIDAGCGDWHFGLCAPRERKYGVVGIDVSETAIQKCNVAIAARDHGHDIAIHADLANGSVDVGDRDVRGAVSWRVLHALPRGGQVNACGNIHRLLPEGAIFHIAVLADSDWKRHALGDRYIPGQLNDCSAVMQLDHPWPLYFFGETHVVDLAKDTGFVIEEMCKFTEPTGFKHLIEMGRPDITYWYARLRKKGNPEISYWSLRLKGA